jgi:hypothetical protein
MRPGLFSYAGIIALLLFGAGACADDIQSIISRKDRCATLLERTEQNIRDFSDMIGRLDRLTPADKAAHFLDAAKSKEEYFYNRIDFLRSTLERIESELASTQGVCPPCLTSEVDQFCTQIDIVSEEVTDFLARGREAEGVARQAARAGGDTAGVKPGTGAGFRPDSPDNGAAWKIIAAVDYTDLSDISDIDTSRQETLDSLLVLRETPLTTYAQAGLAVRPAARFIDEFTPTVYVSNHKFSLSTHTTGRIAGETVGFDLLASGEKRLWYDTTWVGSNIDPTDMARIRPEITFAFGDRTAPLRFVTPLSYENRCYRGGRPGYRSYADYQVTPSLELTSRDSRANAFLSAGIQYRDYFDLIDAARAEADSLDVVRVRPELDGRYAWGAGNIRCTGSYSLERYTSATHPRLRHTVDATASVRGKVGSRLGFSLKASDSYRAEDHRGAAKFSRDTVTADTVWGVVILRDTVVQVVNKAEYRLSGNIFGLTPSLDFNVTPALTFSLIFVGRIERYPALFSAQGGIFDTAQFIDENEDLLRPGVSAAYQGKSLRLAMNGGYAWRTVPEQEGYLQGPVMDAEAEWKIAQWVSLYARGSVDRRESEGRRSTNINAAANLTMRF